MRREYDSSWGYPLETRQESTTFTDARVASAIAAAVGTASDPQALAAAEIASGLWSRAFASARVEPMTRATSALTPQCLALIARELVRAGEFAAEIRVRRGRVALEPASWWDVRGGVDESTWIYELTSSGPDATATRTVPGDRVVHCRYAVSPSAPWRGLSPLALQKETAALAAWLELRLRQEASGPVGSLFALPSVDGTEDLQAKLKALAGGALLLPSTSGGWQAGQDGAPRRDWTPDRMGAEPPDSLVSLRDSAALHVLAACGVPVEILQRSDGTALREAWRQFLHAAVQPVARMVVDELARKLDTPGLRLSFDALMASDLSGRARAFQSLVNAGMDIAKAAALAGLMEAE